VYDLTRAIPPGQTRTYGEIATALGDVGASRAVGQALGQNPVPLIVPCHRVLAANGQLGGFSANGGAARKTQLLEIEGALPRAGRLWDL
jgi:methylated-DNA-[protein]-cysteine S-methyltransferase